MRISDWSSDVCSSDLACGLPVVATAVGGIPEQVESLDHPGMPRGDDLRYGAEKATGMLVPPGDSTAMAKAAALLLETPDLRACLTHTAAANARRDWGETRMVAAYRAWFHEIGGLQSAQRLRKTVDRKTG